VKSTDVETVNFLTRSEVSRMLGVSPNTVTRWAREGKLRCQRTLGGHHRFDKEIIEEIRRNHCVPGPDSN
jgi:excisionase family DNA binding protein